MPAELKEVFGEEVLGHTMVLLTCGDYLMGLKEEVSKDSSHIRFVSVHDLVMRFILDYFRFTTE